MVVLADLVVDQDHVKGADLHSAGVALPEVAIVMKDVGRGVGVETDVVHVLEVVTVVRDVAPGAETALFLVLEIVTEMGITGTMAVITVIGTGTVLPLTITVDVTTETTARLPVGITGAEALHPVTEVDSVEGRTRLVQTPETVDEAQEDMAGVMTDPLVLVCWYEI